MVNITLDRRAGHSVMVSRLIDGYAVLALGTVVALCVMAKAAPALATQEAWGHAVVVAVFAVLLPLRWRAARRGSDAAARATRIIAAVLLVVNVIEACVPAFPVWIRVEMAVIAAVMLALSVLLREAATR